MNEEYLSSGFRSVDRAEDKETYARCLSLLDSLPYYQEYKRKSYELLGLTAGMRVLEAGCGGGRQREQWRAVAREADGTLEPRLLHRGIDRLYDSGQESRIDVHRK